MLGFLNASFMPSWFSLSWGLIEYKKARLMGESFKIIKHKKRPEKKSGPSKGFRINNLYNYSLNDGVHLFSLGVCASLARPIHKKCRRDDVQYGDYNHSN